MFSEQPQSNHITSLLDPDTYLTDVINSYKTVTMRHIPKGSRVNAVNAYIDILNHILEDPSNIHYWKQYVLFAYVCFFKPKRGGKHPKHNLTTIINKRICKFMENDLPTPIQKDPSNKKRKLNDPFKITDAKISNLVLTSKKTSFHHRI